MSACVIGHITVKDEEKWAEYRAQVPATLAPWGAELIFRGQRAGILAGQHEHVDTVDAWYDSPEYQALIPLRQQAADLDLIVFAD